MRRTLEASLSVVAATIICWFFVWAPLQFALFPVVSPAFIPIVEVRHMDPNHVRVFGVSTKYKDCEFQNVVWRQGQRQEDSVVLWHQWLERAAVKRAGKLTFGPLWLQIDWKEFTNNSYADVYHRCTWFWFPVFLPSGDDGQWRFTWARFAPLYRSKLYN